MATEQPFMWGMAGKKLTQDQIDAKREIARALMKQGMDYSPVGHWAQGLSRVAQGVMGAIDERQAGVAQDELTAHDSSLLADAIKAFSGGSSPVASAAMPTTTGAGEELAATSPAPGGMDAYRNAIASIESAGSGDYSAVGPTNPKLGRALGRYQIMEANIGPWSQEVLGRAVSPDEFLADPKLQDAIFDGKFGQYVEQFGPEGAAQAWFAGPGGVGKLDRKDVLGTDVGTYGRKFLNALGPEVAAATPQAAIEAVAPSGYVDPMVSAPNAQAALAPELPAPVEVAPPPAVAEAPQRVAQALPAPQQAGGINPAILRALTDPRATPQTQAVARALMQQQMQQQQAQQEMLMQQQDPLRQLQLERERLELEALRNPQPKIPDSVRALQMRAEAAGLQPDSREYQEFMVSGGRGPLVNVNTGNNSSKFKEESDKSAAQRLGTVVEEGQKAGAIMSDMQQLTELGKQIQTGLGAQALVSLGPYAEALGVDIEGLGPAQAYKSIIDRLAPQMRPAGAGATSDFDARQFLSSLPNIGNNPAGNEIINQTFQAIAQNKMEAAAIARRAQREEISWQDAEDQIAKLPNPYQRFKEWRKNSTPSEAGPATPQGGQRTSSGIQWSIEP